MWLYLNRLEPPLIKYKQQIKINHCTQYTLYSSSGLFFVFMYSRTEKYISKLSITIS